MWTSSQTLPHGGQLTPMAQATIQAIIRVITPATTQVATAPVATAQVATAQVVPTQPQSRTS